jgi:hypothetical protein
MLGFLVLALAVAAASPSSAGPDAGSARPQPHAGESYEISLVREATQKGDGSSGSSFDRDVIVERVIGVRSDGLELEYDLPATASKQDRAREWIFPVRVLRHDAGTLDLLNRAELETRLEAWLKAAKWTPAVCGHWIFTWNAFHIECDPEAAIRAIEPFDMRYPDVREGAPWREKGARAPGALVKQASSPSGQTFTVLLEVDADDVRRARAEADVAVGEITRKPLALEAALRKRAGDAVSGTIKVTLETDAAGAVRRKIVVSEVTTRQPDGASETTVVTQTLERRRIALLGARHGR